MSAESPRDPAHGQLAAARRPLSSGVVASAHLANDAVTSMLPALLPFLGSRFQLAPSELALFASLFAVSTTLPQPLFGLLADRFGGHRVAAIGLSLTGLLIASLSFAPSPGWLGVVLLTGGLGSAALHPAAAGLSRAGFAKNPGLGVALFDAAGMAGGAAGPLLAITITSALGLAGLGWVAVPALVMALVLFWFGPRYRSAVGESPGPSRFSLQLLRGPVGQLALAGLCSNVAALTFTSATPVWLVTERGIASDSPVLGWTLAVFSSAAAAGGILGGALARWFRPGRVAMASLTLSLLAFESVLVVRPGSLPYFAAVATAGALIYLPAPLLMVRALGAAPGANSAVAGILLGGTATAAALIYTGLGAAQATFGIGGTMAAAFVAVLPAAHVAARALRPIDGASTADERRRCDDATALCLDAACAA